MLALLCALPSGGLVADSLTLSGREARETARAGTTEKAVASIVRDLWCPYALVCCVELENEGCRAALLASAFLAPS